ncbi:MAG: type III-A CRISPR-associated RAMP protein Csm3 [Anaerolineae bacterium]|nr:type III-A CRISPR-associated RAMP protein Csm3 [Anaerolineae bacterium]
MGQSTSGTQAIAVTLKGRVLITGSIRAVTGLHIGASKDVLDIGGVDLPVIRNPMDRRPYIPGSSLKGKMRSWLEKLYGKPQNWNLSKGGLVQEKPKEPKDVVLHLCQDAESASECEVCRTFGIMGQSGPSMPTRLMVRDILLDGESIPETVIDYTEVKWEAAIDRVTSAATPRQIERVPAGAVFQPMEIVFNIYEEQDVERLKDVITAMQLVEDDYLGGHGSRGSGKVAFEGLKVVCRAGKEYSEHCPEPDAFPTKLSEWTDDHKNRLCEWIREVVFPKSAS